MRVADTSPRRTSGSTSESSANGVMISAMYWVNVLTSPTVIPPSLSTFRPPAHTARITASCPSPVSSGAMNATRHAAENSDPLSASARLRNFLISYCSRTNALTTLMPARFSWSAAFRPSSDSWRLA